MGHFDGTYGSEVKKPFIVFKRADGKKRADCYYVGFLNNQTQKYIWRSTKQLKLLLGECASHLSVSAKASAEEIARLAIDRKLVVPREQQIILGPHLEQFWLPDGEYALRQQRIGRALSPKYLLSMQSVL